MKPGDRCAEPKASPRKQARALIEVCLEPILLPAPVNHLTTIITPFELGALSVEAQHAPPDDPP